LDKTFLQKAIAGFFDSLLTGGFLPRQWACRSHSFISILDKTLWAWPYLPQIGNINGLGIAANSSWQAKTITLGGLQ